MCRRGDCGARTPGERSGERTWTEVDGRPTVLVPVGSLEQHGPHLPLDTDARVAAAVAGRAADRTTAGGAARRPTARPGSTRGSPGTVSIGHEALRLLLVELGRSAGPMGRRLVFVNGHGGNVPTLVEAVGLLRYEGRDVAWSAAPPAATRMRAGPRPR